MKLQKFTLLSVLSIFMLASCNSNATTINQDPVLDSISISTYPQMEFKVGDTFNVENGVLSLIYTIDSKEVATQYTPLTLDMISNVPDMNIPVENYQVNVSYVNKVTSYTINIKSNNSGNEKEDVSIDKIIIDNEEYSPSTYGITFEKGTNLTPTFKTTPADAKNKVQYIFIDNVNEEQIEPSNMIVGHEYALRAYIKDDDTYNDTTVSWIAFSLTDTSDVTTISKIQVKIADKVLDMGTYGENNTFLLGTDITPIFITEPKIASKDINYKIIINDDSGREVTKDNLIINTEYSIHISLKEGSKYTYSGKIWVNFSLISEEIGNEDVDGMDLATYFDKVDQVWGVGNNGVSSKNVSISGKTATLTAYDSTKTGACLKSKTKYGQGSFEVTMKTNAKSGVCTALWLYYNNGTNNYEIDIELHHEDEIWFSTWLTETNYITIKQKTNFKIYENEYHTYRIDWYNGSKIEFYVDNKLACTLKDKIPTQNMYIWLGMWYPKDWAGEVLGNINTLNVSNFSYKSF